jgi:lysophosphatidic acid acyltransferase / lysophosphatidylinositol acyltransferase
MAGWLSSVKRSPLTALLMAITYFMSGLIINACQLALWIGVRTFDKNLYRRLNYYLAYSLYSRKFAFVSARLCGFDQFRLFAHVAELVFLAEWWAGCDLLIYIDRNDFDKYYGKEHGYLIMNHAYDIDWLMGWVFCERIGLLGVCIAFN